MKVIVRFEYGQEDRFGDPYGPFDAVQVTYNLIRGIDGDKENEIAYFDKGLWRTAYDKRTWSDFIVSAAP